MKKRVIFDTNVWCHLADAGRAKDLFKVAREAKYQVLISPSILMEITRNPKHEVRQRHVDALFQGRADKMRTEAHLESLEIVEAVRSHHPEWLLGFPNTRKERFLETNWRKGTWATARKHSELFYENHQLTDPGNATINYVNSAMKERRRALQESKGDWSDLGFWSQWIVRTPDWFRAAIAPDISVEGWRLDTEGVFWHQLHAKDSTYADWVGVYVDLQKMLADHESFARFFLKEVSASELKQSWIRAQGMMALSQVKVSGGHASDNQHMGYLPDCDLFVTTDARFGQALDMVSAAAPFDFPQIAVPGSIDADTILFAVETAMKHSL